MSLVQLLIFFAVLVNVAVPTRRPEPTIAFVVRPLSPVFKISPLQLVFPPNEGEGFQIRVIKGEDLINFVNNMDRTQLSTIRTSPFVHMEKWQKYMALSTKLFIHERGYNVEPGKYPGGDNLPTLLVNIHDVGFPDAIDKYDDGFIEEREIRTIYFVKKYFRLAAEKYTTISLVVNKLLNLIEEANLFDKKYYPRKVKSGIIVNSDVAVEKIIDVKCFRDEKCFDKKLLLRPEKEIEKFKKHYKIVEGPNCTVRDESKMYLCKSRKKEIHAPFVLYEIMIMYQMKGIKPEWFDYVQTYQGKKRVEMLDMYRLRIKKYELFEPDSDEFK